LATSRYGRETGLAAQSGPPDAPRHGDMKGPDLGRKTLILVPQHGFLPLDPVILDAPRCLIGSGADCRIRIAAKGIAEHHAMIIAGPHRVVLTAWDKCTWLNEFPVRECTLRAGDRLAFGPIELLVRHATPAELARHSTISSSPAGATPHDSVALPRALPSETAAEHVTVAAPRPAANPQPEQTGHKRSDINATGRTRVANRSTRPGSSQSDSARQTTGLDAGSNATELCDVLQQAIADGVLSASVTDLLRSPPTGGRGFARTARRRASRIASRDGSQPRTADGGARISAGCARQDGWRSRIAPTVPRAAGGCGRRTPHRGRSTLAASRRS